MAPLLNAIDLKAKKHSSINYGLSSVLKTVLCIFIALDGGSQSQDTVFLKGVEVNAKKYDLSALGKRTEEVDSLRRSQYSLLPLSDLLNQNSSVYIKNYGPGSLATTAFRGGSAEQTAVIWEGFNLQNPMLGQSDLALMPSFLFERTAVEYGGSTGLWGSGAVGGSIRLDNPGSFRDGASTAISLGTGNTGQLNAWVRFTESAERLFASGKVYRLSSTNKYEYSDIESGEKRLQRTASYLFNGYLQTLKFLVSPRNLITINAWLNDNRRSLPVFNSLSQSKSSQRDEALRFTAGWSHLRDKFRSTTRAASFKDKINYNDSLISLFAKNDAWTLILENSNFIRWGSSQEFNFGINYTRSTAVSTNYSGRKEIGRISLLAGNRFSLLRRKLQLLLTARAEYFSAGNLPLTGGVSFDYLLNSKIKLSGNVARVYRQPTMNELFWQPGGNKDLKPEEGFTSEGSILYEEHIKKVTLAVAGSAYSREIRNWIFWLPGSGGNPTPLNLLVVWSRGSETSWKISYRTGNWKLRLNLVTGYVLSTVTKSDLENNSSLDRQLVNTPRYTFNSSFDLVRKHSSITYFHQYAGYRFTTSDNSQWLEPNSPASIRVNHTFVYRRLDLSFFGACNNLWNEAYEVLPGRPMPLRNFEAGITLNFKPKPTIIKQS